jgi:hypothetical protein
MRGRVAVLKAYGGEFELREYPVPEVEPRGDLDPAHAGGDLRVGSAYLAG